MRPRPQRKTGAPLPAKVDLGTFAGVFTPSILTILGIILFLRMGWVVGNGGLGRALLMISLANAISVLTALSLSAVASNLRVKGGGDYYLISRTLGLAYGGAIGIVLFLAQSVSIAFYCIGFGEAVCGMLPPGFSPGPRLVALCAVSFLFIFAWLGADWATRFQYVVMALLGLALFSFFAGGLGRWEAALAAQNWAPPAGAPPFWALFAIFFPAVTGFTQGVSMSGDLKDPGQSLPRGTLWAVGLSVAVYLGAAFVFAGALPSETLVRDTASMKRVALFAPLVDAGVIAATLSSAMASYLGAPRILQSLAADRIFPILAPFAAGAGRANNPRRGVLLSTGIALCTIALGNLNIIAPVVSMFFLISYGLLNYATFYEARAQSPSFRPRFRWFDHRLSLAGFVACLGAMLAIDLSAGLVAASLLLAIYQYLQRTAGPARWADSRRSHALRQVREHLIMAAREPEHPRDWRPQILAFTADPNRRVPLLRFASWIQGRSGLTTAVHIIQGEGVKAVKKCEDHLEELRKDITSHSLPAFPLVVSMSDFRTGGYTLLQSYGVGPLKANMVLVQWMEDPRKGVPGIRARAFGTNLRVAARVGCHIVILDEKEDAWERLLATDPEERRIDVWWGEEATTHLMLLLAHLMTRTEAWEGAHLRILSRDPGLTEEDLSRLLEEVRIPATPLTAPGAGMDELVLASQDASVVFVPFRLRGNRLEGPDGADPEELLPRLPVTALVLASQAVDLDAEPEDGPMARVARAQDDLEAARKRVQEAEKEADRAREEAEEAQKKMEKSMASAGPGADRETMEDIERQIKEAEKAQEKAEAAAKQRARAVARLQEAEQAARETGALKSQEEEP